MGRLKVLGVWFEVPDFITVRKIRYAHNTSHSFKSHANDTAKRLREKGFKVLVRKTTGLDIRGKAVNMWNVYLRRKKK